MSYQLCPKCQGTGIMSRPPGVPADQYYWQSSSTTHTCDVCQGLKILYVTPDRVGNITFGATPQEVDAAYTEGIEVGRKELIKEIQQWAKSLK